MRRSASLLFSLLCLLGILARAQEKPVEIIILHTNDMHSKIDNMAKLAYLADSLKKTHPHVFLVSAGDNMTGNPVVDMVPDKGYPMIDLMNRCGFDVSALGNHEFDMDQPLMKERFSQAKFPFISCNTDGSKAVMGPLEPYHILKAGKEVTIALLGLIQLDDNGMPSAHPSKMTGVKFTNGLVKAKEYRHLRNEHPVFIALSHLGLPDDIRLADSLPELDAIIGGHSHTVLEKPRYEGDVMIVQTGAHMKYVGKMTLLVHQGRVTAINDTLILFTSLRKERPDIRREIDQYNNNEEFNRVVGTAAQTIEGVDELGSLMTDAITDQLQVDFAFQNKGGIRMQSLAQGPITLKDIYKLDPFNNQIVIYSMTPAEIRSLICYGYRHEKGIDLQVSGMTYTLTGDGQGGCAGLDMIDRDGKPLDPAKEYSVGINNYVAYTYQFDHRDPGTVSTLTTAEVLVRFLGARSMVDYKGVRRAVEVTPDR